MIWVSEISLKQLRQTLFDISKSITENGRSYKGFNLFDELDFTILLAISRGEFNISGFQNKNLRQTLTNKNSQQVSRILKRLHSHRLIKKIRNSYKYYLTKLGRAVVTLGIKLKQRYIVPQLCSL